MAVQLDHKSKADLFSPFSMMLDPQMQQLAKDVAKKASKFFSAVPYDQAAVFTCQFSSSATYNDNAAKVYAITLRKGSENAKVVNNKTMTLSPEVNMTGPEFAIKNMPIRDFSVDCNIPSSLLGIEQQIIAKLDSHLEKHAQTKLMNFIIAQHKAAEEPDPDDYRFTHLSEILKRIDSITYNFV
jgi:hypothetical protein